MKKMLSIIFLVFFSNDVLAEYYPNLIVQLKYSPWGVIFSDQDDFDYFSSTPDTEKYDMHFERSLGARVILAPFYVAANRSTTNLDQDIPDTLVETLSLGFSGTVMDVYDNDIYLTGAIGAGKCRFKFKNPDMNDWEAFFEAGAEIGFDIEDHLLIGVGVDWQLFGEPGDTKANYWNMYVGTGISF
jgi:hypothetical protein